MGEWKYLVGDVREVIKTLPDKSIQCVVTSPPYWGLRDYGVEGQLGLESTPEEYVDSMVEIFREVKRVLRKDGTVWLNLGDSYWGGKCQSGQQNGEYQAKRKDVSLNKPHHQIAGPKQTRPSDGNHSIIKPKDLVGIPWMVAFALRADGWWLRSDIIWSKPNPMPESVTDRPTKSHEYIFLLTKSKNYYYDADAIREKETGGSHGGNKKVGQSPSHIIPDRALSSKSTLESKDTPAGRNKRTVWEIATQPYPGAHFAVFPDKLIEPCILAGSTPKACKVCGAPFERDVERVNESNWEFRKEKGATGGSKKGGNKQQIGSGWSHNLPTKDNKTLGWKPTCDHNDDTGHSIILDPFAGSGTTIAVARRLGRSAIGIDINPEYEKLAKDRARLRQDDILGWVE